MKVWSWRAFGSYDGLKLEQRPMPQPRRGEVLVRMRASSLNQRDIMAAYGKLPRSGEATGVIPLSDGAGDIVSVGEGVRNLAPGDRVISLFCPRWLSGPLRPEYGGATRGSDIDGVLAQYVALPETDVLRFPDHLDYVEAATIPCAAVTAWAALFTKSGLQPGETVLVLGSGGVALFVLQFAKASGARVIMTTSSDERGERLKKLGADGVVNYRTHADWPQQVRSLTGGAGADVVVETGGGGTYPNSLQSAAWNGRVAIVGLIAGMTDSGGGFAPILFRNLTVRAVHVGSTAEVEALLRFARVTHLKPIIDSRHRFDDAPAAYRRLESGQPFGKVAIEHD